MQQWPTYLWLWACEMLARGIHGLYTCGLYSYGLYSQGLHNYGRAPGKACAMGGMTYTVMACVLIAYAVIGFMFTVMAVRP